jgi:hypothetical protein
MRRYLAALAISAGVCFAQATPTQTGQVAQARKLLQSWRWADKAWGAHLAIGAHDEGLSILLIDELRRAQSLRDAKPDSEEYCYVQALFDALIQIEGKLPAAAILPFERQWRPEVLILIARLPDREIAASEDALLSILDEVPDWLEWFAISDLLTGVHSLRFYRRTLEQIYVENFLVVQDSNERFARTGQSHIGGMGLTWANPAGFPPIGFYEFDQSPRASWPLAVGGPRPVYYHRLEAVGGGSVQRTSWRFKDPGDPECVRVAYSPAYLPRFGATDEEVYRVFTHETAIQWKDAAQFSQDADAALRLQAAAIRKFIQDAHRFGLGDVSGVVLKIVPVVEDRRRSGGGRLPQVEVRDVVLQ